ncbi:hypothetical protein [Occallatibacter riparius]|uniref:Uncharacterized protein n=1 Tax=Occallatibacter riparius TaxID=1002689 RepID=A0A9J7BRF6_9BACT|nr:hypothetical protein [Occallatibacter riparius]UWZ85159.1 hypothetical protein MOP44_04255 [Occallatibacter riparius]
MGMFDEVLCNNDLFGAHRGETHQTKSLEPMFGGRLEQYEITPAGRLEFLEYVTEDHSDPNAQGMAKFGGMFAMVFTGGRKDMNYHGWLELSRFGRAKFTDGVMVAFEPERAGANHVGRLLDISAEAMRSPRVPTSDYQLAADLGALGYPGYAHLSSALRDAAEVLLDALDRDNLDARIAEALPWLPLQYPQMNWRWIVAHAKLRNRQNRLGFVVNLSARVAVAKAQCDVAEVLYRVVAELRKARLAANDTFCHVCWPPSERRYAHEKRSRVAAYWNLDTRLTEKDLAWMDLGREVKRGIK